MQISITEITIIIDTLIGSLRIADNAYTWKYPVKERERLANNLLSRLDNVTLKLEIEKETDGN